MSSSLSARTVSPETCLQLEDIYLNMTQNILWEKTRQKIDSLPIDIKEKVFHYGHNLNQQPSEFPIEKADLLHPQQLHNAIVKVVSQLFPQVDFSEKTSLYKRLLNIYQAAKKDRYSDQDDLSETIRWEIVLLPEEVAQNIFKHISYLNRQRSGIKQRVKLNYVNSDVSETISKIADAIFQKLTLPQQEHIKSQFSFGESTTFNILQTLDQLNELLHPCSDFPKLIALLKKNPKLLKAIPIFISNLNIEKEADRIEIARLCASHDGYSTALFIQKFQIKDEAARIEIANSCAQQNAKGTARVIRRFDIKDEAARIKIAKSCASLDGEETAHYIHTFDIKDEAARIEIATLCVQQSGEAVFYIKHFKIKDEAALIKIAKLCALHNGGTAYGIKDFEIKDEAVRIEIAELCSMKNAEGTAESIKDFHIHNEAVRIKIAQLCAHHNGWFTAKFIRNFDIKNETDRIEIAKNCASQNAQRTAEYIQHFDIQDEAALITIAYTCARQDAQGTAQHIKNFNIKDEAIRIEIANICANLDSGGTARYIQNFDIKDEAARTKIAKLCALENSLVTAMFIVNFDIHEETDRIEIIKLCAQQDGLATAELIKRYDIKDQDARIEIAKLCANQAGVGTAERIQNFNIQDLKALHMILSYCAFSTPNSIQFLPAQVDPKFDSLKDRLSKLLSPLEQMKNENPTLEELKTFLLSNIDSFIQEHLDQNSLIFKQAESLKEIKDLYALQQASSWIASMLFFLAFLDPNQQKLIEKAELLKNLLSIRSPILRQNLSKLLNQLAHEENGLAVYFDQVNCKRLKKKEPASKDSKLLDLILASLQISGISKGAITRFKSTFYPLFKGHIEIRPLLETLYLLDKSKLLSAMEKERVLNQLCAELKGIQKQTLFALQAILLFNEEEKLKNTPSIQALATTVFQEKLQVDIAGGNFLKFQQLFLTERNPNALITYAAQLLSLNEIEIKNDLGRYVNNVLHGTFLKERYQLDNNPHLQKLAEYSSDLLCKWQSPLVHVPMTLFAEEESSFDPTSWLQDKMAHDHMRPNELPYLAYILEGREFEEDYLLDIEKALKNLLKAKDKAQQIAALEEVAKELQKLPICAFKDDVKAQLDLLNKPVCNLSQEVHVIDTDDYQDLLLCGTEVVGSCQNVNGQPRLNSGLLGYLLDGKNRLIALKDKQGKIIARAKLSILWDGEKPALYLENVYSQGKFKKQCLKAIAQMALAKAQELGIPLTADKESIYCSGKPFIAFGKGLQSLGGASYEYVDALKGVQKNGIYQIDQAQIALIS